MIHCSELNKDFETKEALFDALRSVHKEIITRKKEQIYKSCEKGSSLTAKPIDPLKLSDSIKNLAIDSDYYYIAVNTTKILDSHKDLHLNGIWNKTVKEQQGKVYLVADHKLELDKTIAKREYIEMFTANIPFALLGKPYEGDTEALIYKIRKDKIINKAAKEWLDSGDAIEASVRMQYVDMMFAANSNKEEDKQFKSNYDKYINEIANKEDFEDEILYFWPIKQAKNKFESSLVLFGSNNTTGLITEETAKEQPEKSTDENQPEKSTEEKANEIIIEVLNKLKTD